MKNLSHLSALIAGFSMVALVEISFDGKGDLHRDIIYVAFSTMTALVVCLMLLAMLTSTYTLGAILRYDTVQRELPFQPFWKNRCESDWRSSFKMFRWGIKFFIIDLLLIGWVRCWEMESFALQLCMGIFLSIIALFTLFKFVVSVDHKWADFLMEATTI